MTEHIDNPVHHISLEEPATSAKLGYHRSFTAEVAGRDTPMAGDIAFTFRGDRADRKFYAMAHIDSRFKKAELPCVESTDAELPRETIADDEKAVFFVESVVKQAIHQTPDVL